MPTSSQVPAPESNTEATIASIAHSSTMRALIHAHDWNASALGPLTAWPAGLRVIVDLMLDSAEPMVIWWGCERLQIYNDAYAPRVDAGRWGSALGQAAATTWKHEWAKMEPLAQHVFATATSGTCDEFAFSVERNGRFEEAYWTYSLTPVRDDGGLVQGVLVLASEITERVLTGRRQRTLDRLREALTQVQDLDQLAVAAEQASACNPSDLLQVGLQQFDARAIPVVAPDHMRVKARDVGIDLGLAIDFTPAPTVALDDSFRTFGEQFTLLLASAQQRIESEARHRMAQAERDRLLLDAPVGAAVMLGEDLVYHLVNAMYAAVSGRPADEMVNKPFVEVYPELLGSPVHEKFKEVYQSGKPYVSEPTLVQIHRHGGALDDRYFTYNLSPLLTLSGDVYGLMVIAVDITTEVESRSHVERLNVELNAAARAKDEFLAMLAHELRNPLAPIGAAAELLQIMRLDEKKVRQTSQVISRQVRHMTALVDDLLDVSRLTRGLVDLDKAPLDMRDVVHDAVEQVTPLIQARGHRLSVHQPPGMATISGDKKRLVQVVANILNNAAKYTPEHGNIVLRVDVCAAQIVLEVEDNGIGMEPDLVLRAFDLFAQAQRTPDRSSGGLGLGLALVRSLTELHGGIASCRSPGLGKGSTFSIHLPQRRDRAEESDRPFVDPAYLPATTPLKILVVDDNVDAASMIALLLEAAGHQVMVEHSSRSALERARQEAPPVCILDIGLPEMDGIELARRLRAQPETAHAFLIAVTGYGQAQDREQTEAGGFDRHLVKPADIKQLLAILADIRHQS